jgi:hypothetical protein
VTLPGEYRDQDGESAPQRVKLLLGVQRLPVLARWRAAGQQEPGKGCDRTVQAARQRRGELAVEGSVEGLQAVGPCPRCQVALDEPLDEAWQAG